jgi:exonuclease V gamma subunit
VDSRGAGGVAYGTGPNLERELAVITPEEARQRLGQLVVGYYLGQRNLIAYAPETSGKLAAEPDPDKALEKAAEAWVKESSALTGSSPGEGTQPATMLAWREQDPFSGGARHQWLAWANSVAKPLREWWRSPAAGAAPGADPAGATTHKSASSKKKAAPTSR